MLKSNRCGHLLPKLRTFCVRTLDHKYGHYSRDHANRLSDAERQRRTDSAYLTRSVASERAYRAALRDHWRAIVDTLKITTGCVQCGFRECLGCGVHHHCADHFDLDHVDPSTKEVDIAKAYQWPLKREPEFRAELAKCQVLCIACHRQKSFIRESLR